MELKNNLYDVIIVGGGPAGLSAAIYMARARYKVLVMEKEKIGGQITITSEIVNYPGVEKTSGTALTQSMKEQAEAFGAEFMMAEVLDMELEQDVKILHTTAGEYEALGVILATGANPRKLGFKGEKEFQGRGVAYCATCDGEFFTGMDVFVIGGGFAAVEEGIFLTKYAKKVTMIVREEDFTCARTVADQVKKEPKIEVKFNTEIVEAGGDTIVSHARFRNNQTGEEWSCEAGKDGAFGIFVFAGYVPNTGWLSDKVKCDEHGYLITNENRKTSVDGVYGAGDVCIKNLRQVVTAVSDGAVAATSLEKHVSMIHEKLKLPELPRREADLGRLDDDDAQDSAHSGEGGDGTNVFLSAEIKQQLAGLFPKFAAKVILRAELDNSPLAGEMSVFMGELEELTDKVVCIRETVTGEEKARREAGGELFPAFRIEREDGSGGNILFHGVPGGHEFNSFVIALYNMAGPGQPVDDGLQQRIKAIEKDINVKVMVSLSCTMCPEVVMGVQRAASLSGRVTGEMIDLMHYPELKKKYKIMSVPCMVINDSQVYFGKKNLEEVTALLEQAV
ncbi:FAD-dependent oxidoreductase [Clostridium sp. AN503]|uniref:FAD-dependent oxidoreductase n=1 Tax=Clostridium sp. AN503 TaxID=3160598 RepID=UPI00345B1A48